MVGNLTGAEPRVRFGFLFWIALVVLVLNDHLLKGSGWLPGWLTGKLSDFAGLLVAPMVGAGLIRARSVLSKGCAVLFVALGFVAIKLNRPAADAAEAALSTLGVDSRIWCDATDLMALVVLPLAFWLMRPAVPRHDTVAPFRATRSDYAGVILGGLSCVATTADPDPTDGLEQLVINATRDPVAYHLYSMVTTVACITAEADPEAAFAGAVVELERCGALGSWEYVVVGGEPTCGAVVLTVPGLTPTVIFWKSGDPNLHRGLSPDNDSFLHSGGDWLYLDPAPTITTWDFTGTLPEDRCDGAP